MPRKINGYSENMKRLPDDVNVQPTDLIGFVEVTETPFGDDHVAKFYKFKTLDALLPNTNIDKALLLHSGMTTKEITLNVSEFTLKIPFTSKQTPVFNINDLDNEDALSLVESECNNLSALSSQVLSDFYSNK